MGWLCLRQAPVLFNYSALAFLFEPGVARQVREGLPKTMRSLKACAGQSNKTPRNDQAGEANPTTV
jgi:hypothetical protein